MTIVYDVKCYHMPLTKQNFFKNINLWLTDCILPGPVYTVHSTVVRHQLDNNWDRAPGCCWPVNSVQFTCWTQHWQEPQVVGTRFFFRYSRFSKRPFVLCTILIFKRLLLTPHFTGSTFADFVSLPAPIFLDEHGKWKVHIPVVWPLLIPLAVADKSLCTGTVSVKLWRSLPAYK